LFVAAMASTDLASLLAGHPTLSLHGERVRDSLTGHEMPQRADAVAAYLDSRRYRLASEWAGACRLTAIGSLGRSVRVAWHL